MGIKKQSLSKVSKLYKKCHLIENVNNFNTKNKAGREHCKLVIQMS